MVYATRSPKENRWQPARQYTGMLATRTKRVSLGDSTQYGVHHVAGNVGEPEVAALEAVREPRVIESEEM